MIFILNRYGRIIEILSNKRGTKSSPFFDDVLVEDLKTGAETYSFSTIVNKDSTDITVGNYIAFKRKGKFKLFQIVSTEENHSEQELEITAYCESAGLELLNKVIRARKLTSFTLKKFLETVLTETGWEVGFISGVAKDRVQDIELEDSSVYATLQNNLDKFGVELEFRVEINNGIITGRYIDVYSSRGKVTGKRFEFGKDINNIHRKIDSSELFTALIGVGRNGVNFKDVKVDGINKPLGQDFVADEEAFQRYNNRGYHLMGVFKFETESPEELLRETYKQLQKSKNPKIEYEVDVALLGDVAIGDTVAIVDNAFNPPIHLMARVTKLETSKTDDSKNKCTLANFVEVSSNITSQMRALASKLEGYVDSSISSKFPIGSDDIKNNAIHGNHIIKDSITTQHLKADFIEALDARFESLKAKDADLMNLVSLKANIKDLTATNATIQNLITDFHQSKESLIEKANIMEANIKDLKAIKVNAEDFKAIVGEIDNFKAKIEKVDFLEGDLAKVKNLVGGNISSENIQSGGITGDRLNMKTVFIDDANILNINASKITSGEINTSKILLKSEDGGMKLIGSTQQFLDKKGNVRIQLGKDNKGNFDFYIIDDKGNILFNTNGITGNAISKGLIKGEMIGKGEVGGELINWASFTNEFNKDTNTNKLKASKIVVDKTGQTIDVKFDTVEKKLDQTKETVETHTTQLNVQQGKISSIIADSEIEKDGKKVKLKDAYNTTVKTVDSMKEVISKQKTIIDEHTGKIVATETKTNEVIKDLNSTTSRVSATETNVNNIKDSINKINTEIESNKTKVSEVKHNLDGITIKVGETEKVITSHSNQITNIDSKVDNLKFGGRNLALNSSRFELLARNSGNPSDDYNYISIPSNLLLDTEYTISANIEVVSGNIDKITVYDYPGGKASIVPIINNRIVHTFTKKSNTVNSVLLYAGLAGETKGNSVIFTNVMLEKGNRATDWTPAPEDLKSYADEVAIAKSNLAKEETIALLDGKISEEEKKRIKQAQDNLNIAIAKINEVENKAKLHAEQMKNDLISHSDTLGQKLKEDAEKFANDVAIAKANLAKEQAIADNNKKIAEEEQKRLAEAKKNLDIAMAKVSEVAASSKTYAEQVKKDTISHADDLGKRLKADAEKYANDVAIAKSELAKQQAIANADGKISAEEQKRIKQAQDNLNIAIAKANDAQNKAIAHANEVAEQKKNDAIKVSELHTKESIDKLEFGGTNLLDDSEKERTNHPNDRGEYLCVDITNIIKENLGKEITLSGEIKAKEKSGYITIYSLGKYQFNASTGLACTTDKYTPFSLTIKPSYNPKGDNGECSNWSFYGQYGSKVFPCVRRLKVELGNKATDWSPSTNDMKKFANDVAIAKSNLAKEQAIVENNKKIAEEEQKRIKQAEENLAKAIAKANEAESKAIAHAEQLDKQLKVESEKYAEQVALAKSELAKQQAIAIADGKISAEEQKRIKQAEDNLKIAINKAEQVRNDSIKHSETLGQQLKNDAQKYAEQVAIAKSNLAKEQAISDAKNKIAEEEQKRLAEAKKNLDIAIAKANDAQNKAIAHAEQVKKDAIEVANSNTNNIINNLEVGSYNLAKESGNFINDIKALQKNGDTTTLEIDSSNKFREYNTLKIKGNSGISYKDYIELQGNTTYCYSCWVKSDKVINFTDSTPLHMWLKESREDDVCHREIIIKHSKEINSTWQQVFIIFKTPSEKQNYLMKPFVYGIGETTVWLANFQVKKGSVLSDWTPNPSDLKSYTDEVATSKAELAKQQAIANADGKITQEEQKRIVEAKKNLDMAIARANEVAELKKNEAINTSKTNISKAIDSIEIGGENLVSNLPESWEVGSINQNVALGSDYNQVKYQMTTRLRVKDLIEIKDIFSISYNNSLFSCCLALFDSNKRYLGITSGFIDWLNTGVYKHNSKVEYVAIIVRFKNDANITLKDLDKLKLKVEHGNKVTGFSLSQNDLKKYANDVAIAKSDLAKQQAIANADGKISAEEQKRIKQAQDNLNIAIAKANEAESKAKTHAENLDKQLKNDAQKYAEQVAIAKSNLAKEQAIADAANKVAQEEQKRLKQAQDNLNTAIARTEKAKQDAINHAEDLGKRLKADAQKFANDVAIAKSELIKQQVVANLDGKISEEEKKRIAEAKKNLDMAIAKANEVAEKSRNHANEIAELKKNEAINIAKTNTTNALDGLKIGGRNLILDSKDLNNFNNKLKDKIDGFSILTGDATKITSNYIEVASWNNIISPLPDTEYTLSFYAKGVGSFISYFYPESVQSGYSNLGAKTNAPDGAIHHSLTNEWRKYVITWKTTKTISGSKHIIASRLLKGNNSIQIYGFKLEEGNKSTDWTPAPEDLKSYAEQVALAKSELAKQQAIANADGKITQEEQKRIKQAQDNLNIAIAKANDAQNKAIAHSEQVKKDLTTYANSVAEQKKNDAINAAKGYTNNQVSEVNVKIKDADANIKVLKDQIKTKVTQVEIDKSIKNIKFGGRNLALQTQPKEYSGFTGRENDCQFSTEILLDSLSIGDPVTISFKFKYENLESQPNYKGLLLRTQGSGDVTGWGSGSFPCYDFTKQVVFGKGKSGEIRIEYNYIITNDSKKNKKWYFNIRMDGVAKGKINFSEFMVEYGTHRTAYTPAPEDVQKSIVDSKNEVIEKINKATSEITQTKDSINANVKNLQSETQKITTNVANLDKNLTNKIASNLNDAKSFANQIAEQKKNDAINHANSVAEQKKNEAIRDSRIVPDTRGDNQSPGWYFSNYPRQTITEFKLAQTIKIPVKDNPYGTLETKVPWGDSSGGYPVQTFRSNSTATYQRHGVDSSNWSSWEQIENTTGSQTKVNAGVDAAKQYTNAQITTVNQKVSSVESSINVLKDKISLKVEKTDIDKAKTELVNKINGIDVLVNNAKELASAMSLGSMLFSDPTFKNGSNQINTYNNKGNGTVTVSRVSKIQGCPSDSKYCIEIKTTGEANPNHGGFYFGNPTRANAIFVTRIIAKIPVGLSIGWYSNSTGNNSSNKWLTPVNGTGKWQEYIHILKCGDSGSFSSTSFFALDGGVKPTTDKPILWHLAYATVFDLTENDETTNILKTEVTNAKNQIAKIETNVNGITQRVSATESKTHTIESNLNGKASKSEVSEVTNKVSTLKTNLDSISQRVSNTETKTNSLQSQVDGKASKSELVTTNQKVASIETNMNGITQKVSSTESTTKKISDDLKLKEDKNYRTIYAKGWGNDFINARDVRVSGVRVDDSNTRGLSVVALNPLTLSVEFKQAYDTFGNDAERKNFVAKINELNNGNHIIVITSADAASLTNGEVCEVLYKIGGSAPGTSTPSYREAYALIGKSSLGKGNGVEMYIPFTSQIKRVAEVSVKVSEAGSFLGVNCNNIALALDKANQETKTVKEKFTEFKQSTESFNWVVGQRSSISNILPNGSFIGGDRGWLHNGSEFWSGPYNGYGFKGRFTGAIRNKTNYNNPERYLQTTKAYKVKKNTNYTISFHYACELNVHSMEAFVILSNTETGDYAQPIRVLESPGGTQSNPNEEKPFTYKFNTGNHEWVWVRFDHNGMKPGTNWEEYCWLYVSEVAIYEGDVGNVKWVAKGGESYSNHFQMDMDGFKASFPNGSYTLLDKDGFEWYDAGSGHSYHALAYVTSFGIPAGNPGKAWVKLPREFTKRKKSLKWTVALRGYYYSTYGNFFPFHVHVSGTNEYEENGIIVCPIEGHCRIQNASNPNDVQPQPVTAMLIAVA